MPRYQNIKKPHFCPLTTLNVNNFYTTCKQVKFNEIKRILPKNLPFHKLYSTQPKLVQVKVLNWTCCFHKFL